jgi:polygalacturonase
MELRPAFFQPMNCTNVLVEGVTFLYGAFWTITPTYCENVIVRNVRIETEGEYGHTPNGDGVDPSSSRNVLIENCEFDTGDDCIAIKAGRDADGLRVNKPAENIVIRNCRGLHGHGGIVIGSETSGSIRNISASGCHFNGTDRIVRIKSARGRGGVIENMWFRDLTGENIKLEAIHINMLYTGTRYPVQPVMTTTPSVRNIHFENITCLSGSSYGVELLGLPERSIRNVTFSGLDFNASRGVHFADVEEISMKGSKIKSASSPVVEISDGADISLVGLTLSGPSSMLIHVDGQRSKEISVENSNIRNLGESVSFGSDVSPKAVILRNE